MKKILGLISVLVGALAYLYMITVTVQGTGDGLSLSTFGLWAALAWITCFTMIKGGGNPAVIIIYGIGATTTTVVLLLKGKYGWSGFDSLIAVLVVVCVILWCTNGARWAYIFSVIAGTTAAIPFVIMTWKDPAHSLIIPNAGFVLANTLAFIAGKPTLEDRLYSGVNIVITSLLVIPWLLK